MNKVIAFLITIFVLLACSVSYTQSSNSIAFELPDEWQEISKSEMSVDFSNGRANLIVECHVCSECPDLKLLERMMGIESYKLKGGTPVTTRLENGFLYHVVEDKGINAFLGATILRDRVVSVRLDFWPKKEVNGGEEYERLAVKILESF